jgi:hypothetical protein
MRSESRLPGSVEVEKDFVTTGSAIDAEVGIKHHLRRLLTYRKLDRLHNRELRLEDGLRSSTRRDGKIEIVGAVARDVRDDTSSGRSSV